MRGRARVVAVDGGAGSIRVAAVELGDGVPRVDVLERFEHEPVRHGPDELRWDWDGIVAAVRRGLAAAVASGPVDSIGIDTWAVDYGLLDADGRLLSPPHSYRSPRTEGWESVADRLGRRRLYETTGVQLMPINTVFQLAVHDRDELARASRLLMLPELLVHELTGAVVAERTTAGTTGLLDVRAGTWSRELLADLDVPVSLFPPIHEPGSPVGTWRGIPVHLVAGHDTASAVAAVPGTAATGTAFVSSGTWMLVGARRDAVDVSPRAMHDNFSNELAAEGGTRFLRNVMGLWMLERFVEELPETDRAGVVAAARAAACGGVLDATDDRFLNPASMREEVVAAALLDADASPGVVARCILESLASSTAHLLDRLEVHTGHPVAEVRVVGGGGQNTLLNELLADASGREVLVGPSEATLLGNALVQGVAIGAVADLDEGRASLADLWVAARQTVTS